MIYISLHNEGVDVRRPVQAEHLHDSVYRIASPPYDRAVESWEFEPGDVVECQRIQSDTGTILAATGRAAD